MAAQWAGTLLTVRPPKPGYSKPLNFTNLKPDLAASYTPLANGLGYKFTLRKGVKSNLGNPLTADDVAWSFQRMVNTQAIGFILMLLGNVDTKNPITVTGPLTFTLNLAKPSPIAIDMLQISAMAILDKVGVQKNADASDPWGYDWLSSHVAGFGPYMVSSYDSANQITLVPNPNYYGRSHRSRGSSSSRSRTRRVGFSSCLVVRSISTGKPTRPRIRRSDRSQTSRSTSTTLLCSAASCPTSEKAQDR